MNSLVAIFILGALVNFGVAHDSRCPLNNDGLVVHIPHETDCTKFYKCDWGNVVLFSCPDGLHFNPKLQVCDWPLSAGCDDGNVGGTTGAGEGTTGTTGAGDESTTKSGGAENDCPPTNDGPAVHLPHENCTLFYKCDWGVPIEMPCPDGLHFNPVLQVCDWPWSAGCDDGNVGGTTGAGEGTTGTTGAGEGTTGTTGAGNDSTTKSGGAENDCPPTNDGPAVHLPHENCTLFYKCDWGVPIEMPCPDGLHFNPVLQVCDWPWSAGCDDGNVGGTTGTVGGTTGTTGAGEGTTGTTGAGDESTTKSGGAENDCPPTNDGPAVHLPHENCTLFYKCDWGVPIEMPCPDGLHFNPVLQVCDWPWSAGCDDGNVGGTTGTVGGTSEKETPATAPTVIPTTRDSSSDYRCPEINEGDVVLLPNEKDCTSFFMCDWGRAILMPCPPGLHFNPTLHVCDNPSSAGCA